MNPYNIRQNLVVIEGLDKVGKTTLISKLIDHPEFAENVAFYNFPSFKFKYLRDLTKDFENTTPYLRDLAHALSHGLTYIDMEKFLPHYRWVICDRYYYSSFVYSNESIMSKIERDWMSPSPPIPKYIFYMYSDKGYPDFANSRDDEDPNDSMSPKIRKSFHKKYIKLFEKLEKTQGSIFIRLCVDNKSPEDILKEVLNYLN